MIQSIFSGVSMFHIANATKTYTLDGGRHLDTSALLYLGLHVLSSQFVSPPPFALVGCTIFVSKILLTLAPIMAPTLYKSYEHTFSMLDTHLNTLLSYADPILFVAGLSTYVALIAMGNLVAGGVGLTVMALVFIKQNGYLPSWFDKGMFILSGPSLLHHGWTAPMHLIERILILTQACNFIAMCLLSLLNPKASLPSFYTHDTRAQIDKRLDGPFVINWGHIHAKEVSILAPPERLENLKDVDLEKLYQDVEELANVIYPPLTEGWHNLKKGVLLGTTPDSMAINFEAGSDVLKTLLLELREPTCERERFITIVQEMNTIGMACAEGWLRELNFLVNPHSKDIVWSLHHQLATFRSDLFKSSFVHLYNVAKKSDPKLYKALNALSGGNNNAHFNTYLQSLFWSIWRPYEAEVFVQTQGLSPIDSLFQKLFLPLTPDQMSGWRYVAFCVHVLFNGILHPFLDVFIANFIHDHVKKHYTVEGLLANVYINHRTGVQEWFSKFEKDGMNRFDEFLEYGLTERGLKLLLWDQGVIRPA